MPDKSALAAAARVSFVVWLAGVAALAAGQSCTPGKAAPPMSNDAGHSTLDSGDASSDECARFALAFQQRATCESCPRTPDCECLSGFPAWPMCDFGRCLVSVDCAEVRKNLVPGDTEGYWRDPPSPS